jgi:thymidylate kinase
MAHSTAKAGDIDLLVSPYDIQRLCGAVAAAGFKLVRPSARQYPGTMSFYAPEGADGALIHLHVHHGLYIGHWSRARRLPIEAAVLASAERARGLPRPAPELELLLRVCGKAFEPSARHTRSPRLSRHTPDLSRELENLASRTSLAAVHAALGKHLPLVEPDLFDRCMREMLKGSPTGGAPGRRLRRQLASLSRRQPLGALTRVWLAAARVLPAVGPRATRQLLYGGRIVAFVGGDGAGKSTAVHHIQRWLGSTFDTAAFHLGLPPRSPLTLAVGLVRRAALALGLRAAGPVGALTMLRTVCTARDRYRLYRMARSRAERGSLVLCDRYPLPGVGPDGAAFGRSLPPPATRLGRSLRAVEAYYYRRILPPDLVIFLDVDAEVAARRKRDEDPEYVRARTAEIGRAIRSPGGPRLHIVDAGRPAAEMLADIRTRVWAVL